MAEKWNIVRVIVWLIVTIVPGISCDTNVDTDSTVASTLPTLVDTHQQHTASDMIVDELIPRFLSAISDNSTSLVDDLLSDGEDEQGAEGRSKKKKYKKHEVMMLTKLLMGMKIALLGVVLPLAVLAAKLLSWKAVTLSLLAFMLAKIVFVKNLFMGKSTPTSTPPTAPAAPIIIHSPPAQHDNIWKRATQPRIHLQPEVHVHHSEEHHAPSTPTWTWAEETRSAKDPHQLAYASWSPKNS